MLIRVAREAYRANFTGKNVPHLWPKALGFVLQPHETQVAVLQNDAVNRVDFFADVRARILSQFRCSGSIRRDRFINVWLSPAKALLETFRFFRRRRDEVNVYIIAPGNVSHLEMCLPRGLESAKLASKSHLQLAVLHLDFLEIILFLVPIQSSYRGHLFCREGRYRALCRFL